MRLLRYFSLLFLPLIPVASAQTKHGLYLDVANIDSQTERNAAIQRGKNMNASVARNNLLWHNIERFQGNWNWSGVDRGVDALLANGIQPLFTIEGSPSWANGVAENVTDHEYYIPPTGAQFNAWVDRYKAFITVVANRYKGRVKMYEIWNEPNEHFTWKPVPNVDQYITFYKAIYGAIKAVDPTIEVAVGGLTGLCCSGPSDYNGVAFLKALYDRSVFPDIVAIHPYAGKQQPPDQVLQWENNFTDIALIRNVMVTYGQQNKKLWLTEWGWPSSVVGEANQAVYVEKALQMIKAQYTYVSVSCYFLDMDRPPRYYQGLYAPDGRLKEAGVRFKNFTAQQASTPNPTPPTLPAGSYFLSDYPAASTTNGHGPVEINRSNGEAASGDGLFLTLNSVAYAKGFGVHAASNIRYDLRGACTRLQASIGVDEEVGSQGSVVMQVFADGVKLYDSGLMTGSSATQNIDVSLAGRGRLELITTDGGNTNASDHADWANVIVACSAAPGSGSSQFSYLSDRTPSYSANQWGPVEKDRSNGESNAGDGRVLTVAGATYTKGLGVHASSDIRYAIGGVCSAFQAQIGVDDEVGSQGSVIFQVWGDGTKLFESPLLRGTSAVQGINVNVTGKQELRLVVTDGGDGWSQDHADWADAKLTCSSSGSTLTYLSDRSWTAMSNGWGSVEKDRSNGETATGDGRTLSIRSQTYAKGLGVHASSSVRYSVAGCTSFLADVGIDDEATGGSVIFQVWAGSNKLYDSGVVRRSDAAKAVNLTLSNIPELTLVVTDAGDGMSGDHADWAGARITCQN